MILPIKHKLDLELIRQWMKTQINKYNIRKNIKWVDHVYSVGDKFMLNNRVAYKYEIMYKVPFGITHWWTNWTVTLQYGSIKIRYNICCIKPYKSDTNVEDMNIENMHDDFNIWFTSYIIMYYIKSWKKYIIGCAWQHLTWMHIICACGVFHYDVILFKWDNPQVTR